MSSGTMVIHKKVTPFHSEYISPEELIKKYLGYHIGFIIGLLENLGGTSIYPIRLEILGLKDALIKVLQDFNLQCSMANQLHKAQKRGISIEGY
ncbi:24380_t:CDS:2 [Entrophospora sp. SA101]|nr:24380_t:CDS:2 [Entrophospora sp. SA101]